MNTKCIVPPETIVHLHTAESGYVPIPSDITPELVPLDGPHRHPPEHVTVPESPVVGAGVVVGGGVVVVLGAGVVVMMGVVVTEIDHEAVKPGRTPASFEYK